VIPAVIPAVLQLAATLMAGVALAAEAEVPEPAGYRSAPYRAPVPDTLQGAEVIDDAQAHALWESGAAAFIDVLPHPPKPADLPEGTIWREPPHETIPGASWLPDTGYDALASETLAYLLTGLETASGGTRAAALVFFCKSDCWMSWNAAKRAIEHGYARVSWYPGGVDGWAAAGWPLETVVPATR
jgi:PQQ-dependent catabolism-associated CXXCW motif protein